MLAINTYMAYTSHTYDMFDVTNESSLDAFMHMCFINIPSNPTWS